MSFCCIKIRNVQLDYQFYSMNLLCSKFKRAKLKKKKKCISQFPIVNLSKQINDLILYKRL